MTNKSSISFDLSIVNGVILPSLWNESFISEKYRRIMTVSQERINLFNIENNIDIMLNFDHKLFSMSLVDYSPKSKHNNQLCIDFLENLNDEIVKINV